VLAEVVRGDDVQVLETSRRPRFPLEPEHGLPVAREAVRQHLHRHNPVHQAVPRPVDRAHAPFADLLEERVVAERAAAAALPKLRLQGRRLLEEGGSRRVIGQAARVRIDRDRLASLDPVLEVDERQFADEVVVE